MAVAGGDAVAVVDDDGASVAAHEIGEYDQAIGGSHDRLSVFRTDINSTVESAFSVKWIDALAEGSRNGPSTGQRLGAEFARNQSAVVASRVRPREIPVMVAPFRAEALSAPQLVQGRNNLGLANVLGRSRNVGVGFQPIKGRDFAGQRTERRYLDIPLFGYLLQTGVAIPKIFFFGAQFVVMRNLQHHAQVGTGDAGKAEADDSGAYQQNVQIVDGDMDLAELPVIPACDEKNVEAFLQFFLSVSNQDRRGS